MVEFDLWKESLILGLVFVVIVFGPCLYAALVGRKCIQELGRYPTQAARIHLGIFFKFFFVEIFSFFLLYMAYAFFAG